MTTLSTYLWKEWREQRATLGVLAAVLCAGVAAVTMALPRELAGDPLAFQGAVALTLLATVMSIGSDLLARERNGKGLGFLERLPAGLGTAFRAKLVFFILTLAAAAIYGALLATAAALVRTGELPRGTLNGSVPGLLELLVVVSLWVFAVSAWMPSSALVLPGALLLLAAFAWPVALAMGGQSLSQPSPQLVLAFALLCATGAPLSAWAAFVVGPRWGRKRFHAGLAGIAVAAVFFAPSWVWAAGRYASLANAPFEVRNGWVGPDGRYAFLNLTRRLPHGVSEETAARRGRTTALIVDLEQGEWRFGGEVDSSAFVSPHSTGWRRFLFEHEDPMPLRLLAGGGVGGAGSVDEVLLDTLTAKELSEDDAPGMPRLGPLDFGLDHEPRNFTIYQAGLGHRLRFKDDGRTIERFLDVDGRRVFDSDDLPRGEAGEPLSDVRVRRGRWIARDVHHWVWLDPLTGEHGPLEHVARNEQIGQIVRDGRLLVFTGSKAVLLDPDSGARTELSVSGDPSFEVRSLYGGLGYPWSPLPRGDAPIVVVYSRRESALAQLDTRAALIRLGPPTGGCRLRMLWADGPEAIVLEDSGRLMRYDIERGERELLIEVDALH